MCAQIQSEEQVLQITRTFIKSFLKIIIQNVKLLQVSKIVASGSSVPEPGDGVTERELSYEPEGKLSRRKRKLMKRLSVAELKQLVVRPDVVEVIFSCFFFSAFALIFVCSCCV